MFTQHLEFGSATADVEGNDMKEGQFWCRFEKKMVDPKEETTTKNHRMKSGNFADMATCPSCGRLGLHNIYANKKPSGIRLMAFCYKAQDLHFYFDINPCWQRYIHQTINGFRVWLKNIDESFVSPHFKLFPSVFIDV